MNLDSAIGQFLRGYFATHDRSKKTRDAYACDLEQFRRFAGASTELTDLEPELIEAWAAELKRRRYASSSIQRKMVSVRVFCHYWVRRKRIDENPFWRVRLSFDRGNGLPRILTESEIRRLLDQARLNRERCSRNAGGRTVSPLFLALRDHALLDLLFATGIRVGEAASLRTKSFHPEDCAYQIQGKGRRQRLALVVEPRSMELQSTYYRARSTIGVGTDALFINALGTPLTTQGMASILRKLRSQAGLDKRVTPHMIRHTIATLLLRNGVDLRVVQEFLGHASITSTQRYTHVTKAHLRAALQAGHPSFGAHSGATS